MGEIKELNLSGAKMLGKERLRLKNTMFRFFVTEDRRPVFNDFLRKVFESKTKVVCKLTLSALGGLPRYVFLNGIVTKNGEQCIVTAVDITELKREEEALAAEKRELLNILKGTNAGSWEWNIRTGETIFNERWAEIIGYSLEEISPVNIETWMNFTHPEDLKISGELLEKHFSGELDYYECEARMKHKSGNWVYVLDRGRVHKWDKEGKPLLMSGTHQDITERKQSEEALREALVKAEESDRLKTAFLNNVSHEIRTPLNGILGFGQLMAEPDLSAEERSQYLEILNKNGYRLINTITDIMDISLIVSGSMEVHKKTYNVKQLLEEIRLTFVNQCTEKNLSFSLHTPEETDNSEIHTDIELLEKILFQLLNNAVKFTDSGGINFGYTVDCNSFRFFVKDTGAGINPTARNRIFDNFMQEESSTRGPEGNGLGLSIAKGIVELLGGEIDFESVKGEGSTFFFTIPELITSSNDTAFPSEVTASEVTASEVTASEVTASEVTASEVTASEVTASEVIASEVTASEVIASEVMVRQPVILIAEDDKESYAYIKAILKNSSVEFLSATTGKEAVAICRERIDISLILMDLKMPEMNGIEATKLIKSFRKKLPIIAVTAHAETGVEYKALSAGCNDCITKPYSKNELMLMINKWVSIVKC